MIVSSKDVLNTYGCDWRVALCVTNGYCDMSNHIYIYDGIKLNEQLDMRCKEILASRIRADPSPPSMLSNTPLISLPKSLSCLIPTSSIVLNGRLSPYELSSSPSPSAASMLSSSTSTSQSLRLNTNTNVIINNDDPRVWLPILAKYIRSDTYKIIEQIFQSNHKIYIIFDLPDYSHFKFLQLKGGDVPIDDEENEEKENNDNNDDNHNNHNNNIIRYEKSESTNITTKSNELLIEGNNIDQRKDKIYSRYSMNDTITKTSTFMESTSSSNTISHPSLEHDRSMSLDSARDNSPFKLSTHNSIPSPSSLQINLFSDLQSNNTIPSKMVGKPPTIPIMNSSKTGMKRPSIDELRFALQSDISPVSSPSLSPPPPPSSTTSPITSGSQGVNNKTKTKKKSFFGWK